MQYWTSQVVLVLIFSYLPWQEMQETQVQSLGGEDPLEKGNSYPLQYSGLENPMDKVACGLRSTEL